MVLGFGRHTSDLEEAQRAASHVESAFDHVSYRPEYSEDEERAILREYGDALYYLKHPNPSDRTRDKAEEHLSALLDLCPPLESANNKTVVHPPQHLQEHLGSYSPIILYTDLSASQVEAWRDGARVLSSEFGYGVPISFANTIGVAEFIDGPTAYDFVEKFPSTFDDVFDQHIRVSKTLQDEMTFPMRTYNATSRLREALTAEGELTGHGYAATERFDRWHNENAAFRFTDRSFKNQIIGSDRWPVEVLDNQVSANRHDIVGALADNSIGEATQLLRPRSLLMYAAVWTTFPHFFEHASIPIDLETTELGTNIGAVAMDATLKSPFPQHATVGTSIGEFYSAYGVARTWETRIGEAARAASLALRYADRYPGLAKAARSVFTLALKVDELRGPVEMKQFTDVWNAASRQILPSWR